MAANDKKTEGAAKPAAETNPNPPAAPAPEEKPKKDAAPEVKADPELVAAKIAAGLDKDQAEEVALAQAKHDATLGKAKG